MGLKQFVDCFGTSILRLKLLDLYNIDFFTSNLYPGKNILNKTSLPLTPRGNEMYRYFNIDILYYLQQIYDNNNLTYHDIGCGLNIFKNIFDGVGQTIGYDPEVEEADIKISFQELYKKVISSGEKFDRAYAINSIHFIPYHDVEQRLVQFSEMLTSGSKGLVTLNTGVVLIKSKLRLSETNSLIVLDQVKKFIVSTKINVITLDYFPEVLEDKFTGNIRLIFEMK